MDRRPTAGWGHNRQPATALERRGPDHHRGSNTENRHRAGDPTLKWPEDGREHEAQRRGDAE